MTGQQSSPGRWAKKRQKKKAQSKESYRKTARLRLQEMVNAGMGSKRSKDKSEADTKNKIYSKATFKTYKQQFKHFADWLEQAHPEAVTLEDARGFVDEYLRHLIIVISFLLRPVALVKRASSSSFLSEICLSRTASPRERLMSALKR